MNDFICQLRFIFIELVLHITPNKIFHLHQITWFLWPIDIRKFFINYSVVSVETWGIAPSWNEMDSRSIIINWVHKNYLSDFYKIIHQYERVFVPCTKPSIFYFLKKNAQFKTPFICYIWYTKVKNVLRLFVVFLLICSKEMKISFLIQCSLFNHSYLLIKNSSILNILYDCSEPLNIPLIFNRFIKRL